MPVHGVLAVLVHREWYGLVDGMSFSYQIRYAYNFVRREGLICTCRWLRHRKWYGPMEGVFSRFPRYGTESGSDNWKVQIRVVRSALKVVRAAGGVKNRGAASSRH